MLQGRGDRMRQPVSLVERAGRNARLLRRLNVATLVVAAVVYAGLIGIAVAQGVGPLAVFSSCVMLAEVLVFQVVRTLCDHLDVLRGLTSAGGDVQERGRNA